MAICDYSDHDYEQEFWKDTGREYEDAADKMAVLKLLPWRGEIMLELGAGFGRLAEVYKHRLGKIILFDYAQNLLDKAKWHFGEDAKFTFQQGSVYELPYDALYVDTALMVRVSHHLEHIEKVLKEVARVIKPKGIFVMEYANKRNFKEIVRWIAGKSQMSPFSISMTDRTAKGFYNYHPSYIEKLARDAGFKVEQVLSVSNFRWDIFKKLFSLKFLLTLESLLQTPLGFVRFGPSIYLKLRKV